MPYYRRPYRRRFYRRRRRYFRPSVKRTVHRELNKAKETKWVPDASGPDVITSAGSIYGLAKISQGDGWSNRDGRQVKPRSIRLKFIMQANSAPDENVLRVMVVQARKNRDKLATTDLPASAIDPVTPQNMIEYNVLYDRLFALNVESNTGNTGLKTASVTLKPRNFIPMTWFSTSTTGVSADNGGAIQLYVISTDATNGPSFQFSSTVNFHDM